MNPPEKYTHVSNATLVDASAMGRLPDAKLWGRFKAGDEEAFIHIYQTYVQRLFNLGLQFSQNEALIQDCIQDFFIDLNRRKERLGHTDAIKLYLFKSFRRRIIAYKRKEHRFSLSNLFEHEFGIEIATDVKWINAQTNAEQLNQLQQAVNQLSRNDREIIYFYFYENMTYQELAEVLNYTHVSSARRSVYKILKKLRSHMPISLLISVFTFYTSVFTDHR